jgi:hypothetical protein
MHGDGLWPRVVTKERRSWLFCYQRLGKAREMGLGSVADVSLAKARDKNPRGARGSRQRH